MVVSWQAALRVRQFQAYHSARPFVPCARVCPQPTTQTQLYQSFLYLANFEIQISLLTTLFLLLQIMRTFGAFASMAVVGLLVGLAVLRKVADFGSKSPVARLVARREAVGGEQEDSDAYLNQWFLTKEEIFTSLGGVHRANMPAFSRGNKVAMLLDGSEVLGTMYSEVSSTKSEDKALGSFWSFGGEFLGLKAVG